MKKNNTIFVCGTDTGVGKTVVTSFLLETFNEAGIRAGGFKPLESGCRIHTDRMTVCLKKISGAVSTNEHKSKTNYGLVSKNHLQRADSTTIKKSGRMSESLDIINPYAFKEALAPGVAAQREHRDVSFSLIKKNLRFLQKKYEMIFVEGAGGLLVPVSGKKTNLDLIKFLNIPVLLVARLGLGTINHTLLTLEHLKRHRIKVLGVLLNQTTATKTLAEKTNPDVLQSYGVPVLGVLPYMKS